MGNAEFHESVADVFGLDSAAEAAQRVDELDVSREEFATSDPAVERRRLLHHRGADDDGTMATELGPEHRSPRESNTSTTQLRGVRRRPRPVCRDRVEAVVIPRSNESGVR